MAIKSPTKRPYVKTLIEQNEVLLLYDTGSDVTCINAKSLLTLDPDAKVFQNNSIQTFESAGGNSLKVIGTTRINCIIDSKSVQHQFYVIENLNEKGILGMDFIARHELHQDVVTNTFYWTPNQGTWNHGKMMSVKDVKLEALTTTQVKVQMETYDGKVPSEGHPVISYVSHETHPLVSGMPGLLQTNKENVCTILMQNCAPFDIMINSKEMVGTIENVQHEQRYLLDQELINSVTITRPMRRATEEDKRFLKNNEKILVPKTFAKRYESLLETCHEVFSRNKSDLGKSDLIVHDISLKTKEPVYVKQFKIPDAHMKEVENHVKEWLKLGVVEPCRSKYNSPIFVVPKKDGTLRVVQDFRALNTQTHVDKYSMHDVTECVNQIGRAGSTIFSTLDLTSGFWQMMLEPKSQNCTAFTIPGFGQMKWTVAPMGLLGSPASFQRLVEKALEGIPNVIVYIDDLVIHTKTHEEHLQILLKVFMRLFKHNLKINLKKCVFGSQEVSYLGFRLTPEGIKPGIDKLKAVGSCKPPTTVKEVRQFLGLCNFFRSHVKNFALVSAPLANLTRKDIKWRRGELPPEALSSFRELQTILCSEPIMDYPRKDRPYCLITDAAAGDDKHPGGLGAILTQLDENNNHKVIAYASRKLAKHEKNYTPFLLEMQASIWGMEHFFTYLKGRHFTLFTDHKPLEKLGLVHNKTLNRLQEVMNSYDFTIQYKKGSEMPADFLSRNVVESIKWDDMNLIQEQDTDGLIKTVREFLLNRKLPLDSKSWSSVKAFAMDCFVEDGIVWKRIKRQGEPSRVVLFMPRKMIPTILKDAHGHLLTGHDGLFKTKERIMQCYFWPGMDKDINDHLLQCHQCQMRKKNVSAPKTELTPLPQCTEPNQRVHADLFGPLKTSSNNKKYILCMTDAFSKYVELVPLPNKEALTVASAIFSRWICRFGSPLQVTTDGGKEFTAKLTDELFHQMQIIHLTTTPYHPQCNSQAEVVNKTIAKYLASFVDNTTLDWELYLAPMMFAYNTAIHKSTRQSPYFLTFGMEPRTPNFPATDLRRRFYGDNDVDEFQLRLTLARKVAIENNEDARLNYEHQYNKKVRTVQFHVGQEILLNEFNTLHKNRKLAPKFSGPHTITKLIHDTNVEIKLQNGRKLVVHINRIKPYLYNIDHHSSDDQVRGEDSPREENPPTASSQLPITPTEDQIDDDDGLGNSHVLKLWHQMNPPIIPSPPTKRGRGRPPKIKFSSNGGVVNHVEENQTLSNNQTIEAPELEHQLGTIEKPTTERRITRSMMAQPGSNYRLTIIKKKKGLTDEELQKRLHQQNFKDTGDTLGRLIECGEEIILPPLILPILPPIMAPPAEDDEEEQEVFFNPHEEEEEEEEIQEEDEIEEEEYASLDEEEEEKEETTDGAIGGEIEKVKESPEKEKAINTIPKTISEFTKILQEYDSIKRKPSSDKYTTTINKIYHFLETPNNFFDIHLLAQYTGMHPDKTLLSIFQRTKAKLENSAGPKEDKRPLRSNTKAPAFPKTPSVNLETQLRRLEQERRKK